MWSLSDPKAVTMSVKFILLFYYSFTFPIYVFSFFKTLMGSIVRVNLNNQANVINLRHSFIHSSIALPNYLDEFDSFSTELRPFDRLRASSPRGSGLKIRKFENVAANAPSAHRSRRPYFISFCHPRWRKRGI